MNFLKKLKNIFIPEQKKEVAAKPKKEVAAKPKKEVAAKPKKQKSFFNKLKNLLPGQKKKTEKKKAEEKKKKDAEEKKKIEDAKRKIEEQPKKKLKKTAPPGQYSIWDQAKKPEFELISDISVLVKLDTSMGVEYRYWAIFSNNRPISNGEILDKISDDIFNDGEIYLISTSSGLVYEIFGFSVVGSYRNKK